jgi:hypothetical protein
MRKSTKGAARDAVGRLDQHRLSARTEEKDRTSAKSYRDAIHAYRSAVRNGNPSRTLTARARRALLHLGGDPELSSDSLKDYDHKRYGPFLGVSDDGGAAGEIRDAAFGSPKVRALPKSVARTPLVVGLAVDVERLGGIGEVAAGPEEYVNVWLSCVGRVLVTTNVGTRVNVRLYRREPSVILRSGSPDAIEKAKQEIAAAFKPFVETPDKQPRPLTVFVEIPPDVRMTVPKKKAALIELATFVASGKATGKPRAPKGQALGLMASVKSGLTGRDASMAAIELASSAGLGTVILDGMKRKVADKAISLAGLLDYFEPGIVGPLLRKAKKKNVRLRSANLPDTDTIARSIWVGLTTARNMGANLGKYGCFPLTLPEIDYVVEQLQRWLPNWSSAPVFFVDQGLLREGAVDVIRDLPRGIEAWLDTVASHGVRVVLIDTVDKATGRRLLKKSANDAAGYLGPRQIDRIEKYAAGLGIKVLWAGGFGLRDAFAMGKLGVFGIYVTSAAATMVPVRDSYIRDPALASVKKASKEAVLRTKILLEAGFLAGRIPGRAGEKIDRQAQKLLAALDAANVPEAARWTKALASACATGWRAHWRVGDTSRSVVVD